MSGEMEEATGLLAGAGTWHEFRQTLRERRLEQVLGPDAMGLLADLWQQRQAGAMSDMALAAELSFWADGGTFDQHLQGFTATPPEALVQEAGRRGWFVRSLASGTVVNPPRGKPLMLKLRPVSAGETLPP